MFKIVYFLTSKDLMNQSEICVPKKKNSKTTPLIPKLKTGFQTLLDDQKKKPLTEAYYL